MSVFTIGFKNFFPKGKQTEKTTKTSTEESAKTQKIRDAFKSSSSGKRGTGGGGSGGNEPGNEWAVIGAGVLSGAGLIYFYAFQSMGAASKEISWQEFQTLILESGHVDRLVVSNKKIAKVVLRMPTDKSIEGSSGDPGQSNYPTSDNPIHDPEGVQKSPEKFIRYPRLGINWV